MGRRLPASGVCEEQFPTNRTRTLWTNAPAVLPSPLRGDAARPAPAARPRQGRARRATRPPPAPTRPQEELRLGYVAFTRARHRLWVSSYVWSEPARPRSAPRRTRRRGREAARATGAEPDRWAEKPEKGDPNPLRRRRPVGGRGRCTEHTAEALRRARRRRGRARRDGRHADGAPRTPSSTWSRPPWSPTGTPSSTGCSPRRGATAPTWSRCRCPRSLSATAVARLRDDPDGFARDLARPMPRQPSPAARFGTRFHAWVEARFGQQDLFDPDELPGRGDRGHRLRRATSRS